VPPTLGV
jgi:hypothetical protein